MRIHFVFPRWRKLLADHPELEDDLADDVMEITGRWNDVAGAIEEVEVEGGPFDAIILSDLVCFLFDIEAVLAKLRALPPETLDQAEALDRKLAEGFLQIQLWEYSSQHFHLV